VSDGADDALGVDALDTQTLREALRLWGTSAPPAGRSQAVRLLREALAAPGAVRAALDRAPPGARDAFARLAAGGPEPVDVLLDRGWWGRGSLPPPLDWLQRRALVLPHEGAVHPLAEARAGWLGDTPPSSPAPPEEAAPLRLEAAASVLIAPSAALLDQALTVPGAHLRGISPTVAVSDRVPGTVAKALRAAGVDLVGTAVPALAAEPALPLVAEEAVGPRAVRTLLERALAEQRQIRLRYFASSRGGAATDRVVDPWSFRDDLLRGWCHLRLDERTFALDRIGSAHLLPSDVDHPAP
jgi:WYL domain